MSLQLFETELNGNTDEEFELIRFKYHFSVGTLVDEKVAISKFRTYRKVRDPAINAG